MQPRIGVDMGRNKGASILPQKGVTGTRVPRAFDSASKEEPAIRKVKGQFTPLLTQRQVG